MLPVVLLLVAASALANPIDSSNQFHFHFPDVTHSPIDPLLEVFIYYGDDTATDMVESQNIMRDFASLPDAHSKALGYGQAIALIGPLGYLYPGDACAAAQFIDNYVNGVRDNRYVVNFINSLASQIDRVTQLTSTDNATLFDETGPRGNCKNGGIKYKFVEAWELILEAATSDQFYLLDKQNSNAFRLFAVSGLRPKSVAAAITAVSLPVVNNIILNALNEITAWVGAIGQLNEGAYANTAKQALLLAASNYLTGPNKLSSLSTL